MSTRAKLSAAALALAASTVLAGCASTAPGNAQPPEAAAGFAKDSATLVFGVVPDSVDTETNYQPLMDYLAVKTGKTVEYHESTDYAALIEASVAGKIDVASFSGFTYITATNNGAKLTPVSSIVTKEGQEPGYYSQAIVPVDSEISSVADFKGKKVCFVDPSSTSGYLFPSYNLGKEGIDVKTDITTVFAGKHDVSVSKTAEGKECEVGFAEDSEVVKNDKVKVVGETMVPGAPIVVSDNLPTELSTEVAGLLKELSIDEIAAAGVKGADSDGFKAVFFETKPVDDAYYNTIRDICKSTNASQCQ